MAADVAAARAYAQKRLTEELPDTLTYHTLAHTQEVVVAAALALAAAADVDQRDRDLLEVAAWFHDLGYLVRYEANEQIAVDIVHEVLPTLGFDAADIATIEGLIWATQLPQRPTTLLQELMVDADMDAFGRSDFWDIQDSLRREFAAYRGAVDDRTWIQGQIEFIGAHRYFTEAARARNDAAKARHLDELQEALDNLEG